MAKRRRLSPAKPEYLEQTTSTDSAAHTGAPEGLETKSPSTYSGSFPMNDTGRRAAPIADVAATEAAIAAVNDLTEELRDAHEQGRMVLDLPLDAIDSQYLVRDRLAAGDGEMSALVESIRMRGQQAPIEVIKLTGNQYGLISGWRRFSALTHLFAETRDPKFNKVKALARRPEQASDAYLSMVEENEIRLGLSFFERAQVVIKATEKGVYSNETDALKHLFQNVPRAKRSKIKSFMRVVRALNDALLYPGDISEKFGLSLSKALAEDPQLGVRIQSALSKQVIRDADAEHHILTKCMAGAPAAKNQKRPVVDVLVGNEISLKTQSNGQITLHGRGVTPDFRQQLIEWLKETNRH